MAIETPNRVQEFPVAVIKNIITLATSGFGVVVALAWNEAIQSFVKSYIDPYLGKNSGLVSMFLYAVIITALAVIVSMQLTLVQKRIERYSGKEEEKDEE